MGREKGEANWLHPFGLLKVQSGVQEATANHTGKCEHSGAEHGYGAWFRYSTE
jgi:hypothetical protein